jgi:tRNA(Ile)-lysidine synthase
MTAADAPEPDGPLTEAEFATLMRPLGAFEAQPRLAVAVSGGSDSLALTLLLHDWVRRRGGHLTALTVDHGLRPEAAAEARQVARWLKARGIRHRILTWRPAGEAHRGGLQAAARTARYRLLGAWCRANSVLHLALAHHREDQAETLLLRLGRGSGLDGLAAMAAVSEREGVRLIRPLLTIPRVRLAASLRRAGQDWIEDPSNRDPAHARVRVRALMPALAAEGFTAARLAATAAHLGRARAALDDAVADLLAVAAAPSPAGYLLLDPAPLRAASAEVSLRALAHALLAIGGAATRRASSGWSVCMASSGPAVRPAVPRWAAAASCNAAAGC